MSHYDADGGGLPGSSVCIELVPGRNKDYFQFDAYTLNIRGGCDRERKKERNKERKNERRRERKEGRKQFLWKWVLGDHGSGGSLILNPLSTSYPFDRR